MSKDIVLNDAEDIIGMIRRRPMVEMPRFLFGLIWIFSPFFFFFPLIALGPIGFAFLFSLFLTGCLYVAKRYVMWKSSMLLITTERVIDIERVGFKKQYIFELGYNEIDSVFVHAPGIIGRLLRTGRVQVQTTSAHNFDLEMMGIFKPDSVRQLILDVQYLQQVPGLYDKEERTK